MGNYLSKMRKWFSVWKKEVKITMRTKDLLDSFPGEPEIMDDGYRFTATQKNRVFDIRYEWLLLESDDTGFQLTEHTYLPWTWYLLLTVALTGVCLGYIGAKTLNGILAIASFFATFLLVMLFVSLFIIFLRLESPVDGLFRRGEKHTELMPIASLILTVLPLLFVVLAVDGLPRLLGFLGIVASLIVYAVFHSWVVERSFRWQSRWVGIAKQFPLIAANYITSLGFGSIILVIFITTHDMPLFLALSARWPVLFPLIYAVIILLLVGEFGPSLLSAWRFETSRFQDGGRNINSIESIILTFVLVIAASYGFGYLSYRFLQDAASYLAAQPSVGGYTYVIVSSLPVWYFATGLVYQIYRFFSGVFYLFQQAEQDDLSHIFDVDAETYVLDYEGIYAGAVSLRHDYVIISQGILDQLSEEQVAVVMAHEEGHLKHGDTVVGLFLTLLSPIALTGKNILYGIFDFRAREFRADQYSASRIDDPQQVFNTLDTLQFIKAKESINDIPSLTPTILSINSDSEERSSHLEQLFKFYFGEFAMSQVHPDLDKRKDQLL